MNNAFFEQASRYIRRLISDRQFKQAYEQCKKYLYDFPDEEIFLDLKAEIEEAVAEENKKFIKQGIEELSPLWRDENYADILRKINELSKLDPNNKELKKLQEKAQLKYQAKTAKLQEEFDKRQTERLQKLLETSDEILLQELFTLEKENPNNTNVINLTNSFRDKLIAKRISKQIELLNTNKFEQIHIFIEELKKIDNKSPRIEELQKAIDARQHSTSMDQTREFIYKGEQYLDTLMKLGKYDKVIQAAEELQKVEKDSSFLQKLISKAKSKLFTQTRDLSVSAIQNNRQNLRRDASMNPDKYIKL